MELLADEMAGVLFVRICLTNQTGIDIKESFVKNPEKTGPRDSQRHKSNTKLK